MTVKSATAWSGVVVCRDATGALSTPSVGPVGTLYVDGTANGASVTISGSNPYKWTVTLPALTAGQCVSMYITATISSIATASVVAEDVADTKRVSDLNDLGGTAQTGDAYAVVSDVAFGNSALGVLLTGKIKRYLMLLLRKDAAIKSDYATELGEINADTGTGTGNYDNATDSAEAIRDTAPLGTAMRGTDGAYTGTPPTTGDIAGAILATPANKLATDASGRVTPDTVTPAGPDAATIADQVWDETAADHENIGSTGKALNAAGTAADPWSAALPGTYGAGTAGYLIGNLAANVWGYTTRTLTSLSALVSSVAAAVWAYATRTLTSSAAATTAAVSGSDLAISITTSYAATVTGLTIPSTWTKLWFTVKNDKDSETDAQAILQVLVSNPAVGTTDGVQYVMAGAASASQRTLGSLTPDQAAGTVAIALDETLTAVLAKGDDLDWDIKCLESGGACTVLTEGHCAIARTVTRATS